MYDILSVGKASVFVMPCFATMSHPMSLGVSLNLVLQVSKPCNFSFAKFKNLWAHFKNKFSSIHTLHTPMANIIGMKIYNKLKF
jgi:hypothetical protein